MRDTWLGWCAPSARQDLERALLAHDSNATLTVVDSPRELRQRVKYGNGNVGVAVGPDEKGRTGINLAAAVVHDGMASDVLLVVDGLSNELNRRAQRAGIHAIIDLTTLAPSRPDDLDEPDLFEDELPTMVVSIEQDRSALAARVPDLSASNIRRPTPTSHVHEISHTTVVSKASPSQPYEEAEEVVVLSPNMMMPAVQPCESEKVHPRPLPQSIDSKPPVRAMTAEEQDTSVPKAPIVTFVSGRGGVGKTSVVAAMAVAAASWGMRVALCDLDLSCGNLYSCFGLRGPVDLAEQCGAAPLEAQTVLGLGVEACEGVTIWGGCELPEMAETVMPNVSALLSILAAHHDLVLVDTSSTFTDAVAQAAQQCARLILVVDGQPGSSVAQRRLGSLAVRLGIARTRMMRLANRCGPRGKGEPVINRADLGLETARPLRVLDGGMEVSECLAAGKPQELFDLGSRFAESCASSLAATLAELGNLPNDANAQRALQVPTERPRWGFGKRREAM